MEVKRDDGSLLQIGHRIICDGHFGTVRYIGEITNTKDCWIGVEWDDSSRGKHNGIHEGKQYFSTDDPTGGSFVRPRKVKMGVSFYNAFQDRYGEEEDEEAGVITAELFVLDNNNKKTIVEMVGAKSVNKKQSQLDSLVEVAVRDMSVYGVGPHSSELRTHGHSIAELDIAHSLLPSWSAVAAITECLPALMRLNVSENKLVLPTNPVELQSSFPCVKVLYLNRIAYNWQQILECSCMFPLEQLHVCFNSITTLSDPQSHLQNLTLINLESNNVQSWLQVLHLSHLPKLESLIVSDNSIDTITFSDVGHGETTQHFRVLKYLCINHNKIAEWSSINELNKLKCLKELKIIQNPLLNTATPETVRQLIVAKIAGLEHCNRTKVTKEERRGAEIDYLKRFGQLWIKSGGSQDDKNKKPSTEFTSQHPRYQDLVRVYGPPENSEMKQKEKSLKDSLITINITSPYDPDKGTKQKKIPETMTVQKLKALIQKLFKWDNGELQLSYETKKMKKVEIEFDNDLRPISFYSIEPGDTILVRW
ncbi:tubulin-specific chaperone E-like [Mizuhopecten yessoensis]|uniref:Tubulin-specific chaperone E n=1 Tax=Mizuhopecten yessoensis TaxID=6573 RepID=A0A210Q0C9_MIZYE|nr:tubulin-specific chaperone E-like [Mizuhopecten yessoensis]XP_021370604.1 tubulin-specific chaperone E-like [Mizuhopecten yessoensis]XP_021370605.1 tubulin-specific chaperone E-like [Mizuhopecten yessoensis]XP_021370606.1 tubulin-specific chaperone E-like [Mizuhopecten yessoensis]XP_021370607.1 tubulin-specific chaperone E-like [Mizuhopecten yessoensis]XP_021370608.1 tubulin-specific chaperone E-like [Mizuhopecten yessoensis]XP_021370609.1 tubulin-specific chaperone E-like [Mizuhopecten ye